MSGGGTSGGATNASWGGLTCLSVMRSTSKHKVNSLSVGTETEPFSSMTWPLPLVTRTFWFLRATATGRMEEKKKKEDKSGDLKMRKRRNHGDEK